VSSPPRSGRCNLGKEHRHLLYRRLSRPRVRSGRGWKIYLAPTGIQHQIIQPAASRYIYYAIPTTNL